MEFEVEAFTEQQHGAVDALLASTSMLNPAVSVHEHACGLLAARMAEQAGLGGAIVYAIEMVGSIHDIGLNGVDPRILDKPDLLTDHERNILQLHPYRGAAVLEKIPCLAAWAPIVRSHHERVDGTGYPDGLCGDEIPVESRLLAVADAFLTMTSVQPWRPLVTPFAAITEIRRGVNTQFDADAVHALLRTLKVRPDIMSETA